MFWYYFQKCCWLAVWIYTAVNAWIFVFGPAVAVYGFWKFVGVVLVYTIIANVSSFGFMFTRKPTHEPQQSA